MAALWLLAEKMLLKIKDKDRKTCQEAVIVIQSGKWLGQRYLNGSGEK